MASPLARTVGYARRSDATVLTALLHFSRSLWGPHTHRAIFEGGGLLTLDTLSPAVGIKPAGRLALPCTARTQTSLATHNAALFLLGLQCKP